MKYSIIIAALLGALTLEQANAVTIYTSNSNNKKSVISESDGDSSSDSESEGDFVQLNDDNADHSSEFFTAAENGMTPNGKEYSRELPS